MNKNRQTLQTDDKNSNKNGKSAKSSEKCWHLDKSSFGFTQVKKRVSAIRRGERVENGARKKSMLFMKYFSDERQNLKLSNFILKHGLLIGEHQNRISRLI